MTAEELVVKIRAIADATAERMADPAQRGAVEVGLSDIREFAAEALTDWQRKEVQL